MKNKNPKLFLLTGTLVVAVAFGAVAYRSVFAAAPATTSISTSTEVQAEPGLGRGLAGGYTREGLAEALGISVDELTSAYQEAYSAMLEDAVSQGLITQAQADELTADGRVFPFGGHAKGWLAENGIDFDTYLADALGISVDELNAARQTAVNSQIDQAVADGRITQDQADLMKGRYALANDSTFKSNMQSAFTDAVNQAVESGVITQAQADQILSKGGNMFMPDLGGFAGHGGPRGARGGWLEVGEPPVEP